MQKGNCNKVVVLAESDDDYNENLGYSNRVTPPRVYDFHTEDRFELVDGGECVKCGKEDDNSCFQQDLFEEDHNGNLKRYCYNCWETLGSCEGCDNCDGEVAENYF